MKNEFMTKTKKPIKFVGSHNHAAADYVRNFAAVGIGPFFLWLKTLLWWYTDAYYVYYARITGTLFFITIIGSVKKGFSAAPIQKNPMPRSAENRVILFITWFTKNTHIKKYVLGYPEGHTITVSNI